MQTAYENNKFRRAQWVICSNSLKFQCSIFSQNFSNWFQNVIAVPFYHSNNTSKIQFICQNKNKKGHK